VVEHAAGVLGRLVVQHPADRPGEPVGVQDDDLAQFLVVVVVDDLAEIMQETGQRPNVVRCRCLSWLIVLGRTVSLLPPSRRPFSVRRFTTTDGSLVSSLSLSLRFIS
jgi:hypothetical protein